MSNSEEIDVLARFCAACDDFSSTLKTINRFDHFIDAGILSIPEEKVEEVRNNVKAPLAMMLTIIQGAIEEFQNEMDDECKAFRSRAN